MSSLVKASVALFLAAEVVLVAALGSEAFWVVLGWALAAAMVVGLALLVRNATARVALAAVLVAACVLLALELGLFFVPAAAALLAAAVTEQQHHHRPHHRQPLHAGR